jgi:hypothetical protein
MRKKLPPKIKKATPEEIREKARWARIKRVYGLEKEDYARLDTGKCPICLRAFGAAVRPVIDHDHKDGSIRGILCFYCNHRVVGRHRDSDLIYRVYEYLAAPRLGYIVPKKKPKVRRKTRKVKK